MFRHPAWAVGSCSSGQPAAGIVGTKSTGGFDHPDGSPRTFVLLVVRVTAHMQVHAVADHLPVGCESRLRVQLVLCTVLLGVRRLPVGDGIVVGDGVRCGWGPIQQLG